jgi:glycosyltransferase involved in cell wall biosynthesis
VLHIITGLAAGGAEQQLRLLLRHSRVEAEVAALTNPGIVADGIRADGVGVHDLGMRGNTDLAALPRLVRLIRAGHFDVVHTHLYRACIYGRVAARLAGVRYVVATEHSLGDRHIEGRELSPGIRALYRTTERLGSRTVAVSSEVARRLERWGVPAERLEVIPNGIDLTAFRFHPERRERMRNRLGIPPGRFVVGSVGRLVRGKETDVLLRAVSRLPDVTALIVGEGPERPALQKLAADLGVDGVFTGESAAVPDLLAAMDLLIAPSAEEAFGLAVLEGLAAGLPVFHRTCPAVDDLPAGSVLAARLLPEEPEAVRDLVVSAVRAGPHRRDPPAALQQLDIRQIAARIDDLYERVRTPRSRSPAIPMEDR